MKHVGIIGVGRSTNIGDQLIAQCLGCTVAEVQPNCKIEYFDLYDGPYDVDFHHAEVSLDSYKENKAIKNVLYFPRALKLLVKDYLGSRVYDKRIRDFVLDKDIVIIGGGHLLIDNYSSFALKLRRVLLACKTVNARTVFWSVGVGQDFSFFWRLLLKRLLLKVKIYTRDTKSAIALRGLLGTNIEVVLDPGFFSDCLSQLPAFSPRKEASRNKAFIFIMDPYEAFRHSGIYVKREDVAKWWIEIIDRLACIFDEILISNNGSMSDYSFIKHYIEAQYTHEKVAYAQRTLSSRGLVEQIRTADFVIAQRLHAVIPSVAHGKQVLAVRWDLKLETILSDLGEDNRLISFLEDPDAVREKVELLLRHGGAYPRLVHAKNCYVANLEKALGEK